MDILIKDKVSILPLYGNTRLFIVVYHEALRQETFMINSSQQCLAVAQIYVNWTSSCPRALV